MLFIFITVLFPGIFTKKPKDAGDIITDLIAEQPISLPGDYRCTVYLTGYHGNY